jgi:YVTN family beta-propeller protein
MAAVTPFARFGSSVLSLSLLLAMFGALAPGPVDAVTVSGAWSAKIGSAGANGTATINLYTTGKGALVLKLKKLPAATSLAVTLHKGTCAAVGTVLVKFPLIKSTSAGAAARTSTLTAAQGSSILAATAGTGKLALRVGTGRTAKCGVFTVLPVQPYVAARVTVGRNPAGVAVAPSGAWVTNWWDNTLSRIDPATNGVLQTLSLTLTGNAGPEAIAWGDGSLWVTVTDYDDSGNTLAGSVLRVDPASGQVQATIPLGRGAYDIEVTPAAVWVPAYDDGTLARIDPATNAVVAAIPVCAHPAGVASGFGSAWASCEDGTLVRLDPATNQVVKTIATQSTGGYVAASTNAIWMTNAGHVGSPDGSVTRVDPATNTVVANVPVGSYPEAIAAAGGSLWIGSFDTPTVVRVSATTNAVLARITVAAPVYEIAATDHAVWAVSNFKAPDTGAPPVGTITRINYAGVVQGPFAATPPPATTPSPTPSPTPGAPTPTPSPAAGGTPYSGTYFTLSIPAGWTQVPGADPESVAWSSSGGQMIMAQSVASSASLDQFVATTITIWKSAFGVDPEQNDAITLGGAPARLLAFHVTVGNLTMYWPEAICVHNGRAYQVEFTDLAGNESADRALFQNVLASFAFTSAG